MTRVSYWWMRINFNPEKNAAPEKKELFLKSWTNLVLILGFTGVEEWRLLCPIELGKCLFINFDEARMMIKQIRKYCEGYSSSTGLNKYYNIGDLSTFTFLCLTFLSSGNGFQSFQSFQSSRWDRKVRRRRWWKFLVLLYRLQPSNLGTASPCGLMWILAEEYDAEGCIQDTSGAVGHAFGAQPVTDWVPSSRPATCHPLC